MAEINARTLMFNLGREDAIDSTTSAKIARYAERKQLAYKLTDEGVLLLDGRGKKIHLRNGVVTLRNALGLHALPERIVSRCRAIDPVGDNRVLNKQQQQQQHTNVVTPPTMLHVRKMALVDPRLLKSLRENPTPLSPLPDPTSNAIDTTLRDLDAEMTSILDRSDADESEKVRLYNQALLRYNDMTKARAAKPIPVVVAVKKEAAATMTTMPTTALVVEPTDIVGTLPKTLQMKGRQLMSRLSAVTWNERGELILKGVAIRGSNAVDLIHDLLRNRKTPDPVGWQQFASQMRAANIPMELVGNVTRRLYLQKKRGKRTPQKRKPTTPETPMSEWESLYISYLNAIAESIAFDQYVSTTVLHFRRFGTKVTVYSRNHIILAIDLYIVVVVLSLSPSAREHWSWSGGDRNYTDTTTILNASEVTVALPLYRE